MWHIHKWARVNSDMRATTTNFQVKLVNCIEVLQKYTLKWLTTVTICLHVSVFTRLSFIHMYELLSTDFQRKLYFSSHKFTLNIHHTFFAKLHYDKALFSHTLFISIRTQVQCYRVCDSCVCIVFNSWTRFSGLYRWQ